MRLVKMLLSAPMFSNSAHLHNMMYDFGAATPQYIEQHIERMATSYRLIVENPIFGVGRNVQLQLSNEHNHYIIQASQYGVMSAIIYIIFYVTMILFVLRVLRKTMRRNSSDVSLGIVLFASTISSLFYLNSNPGEIPYCWVLFGLTVAWARNKIEAQH